MSLTNRTAMSWVHLKAGCFSTTAQNNSPASQLLCQLSQPAICLRHNSHNNHEIIRNSLENYLSMYSSIVATCLTSSSSCLKWQKSVSRRGGWEGWCSKYFCRDTLWNSSDIEKKCCNWNKIGHVPELAVVLRHPDQLLQFGSNLK